jgi:outer membrane protein assembly factor BamB
MSYFSQLALTAMMLVAPTLAAQDNALTNWSQWRGPLATGEAPKSTPPTQWSATKNIKWKTPLKGRGSATPIVWQDRIFIVSAEKTEKRAGGNDRPMIDPKFERKTEPPTHFFRFMVFCYDRATGKLLWEKVAAERVPHEGHHETHSYAAGSPVTDGKFLYVSFGSFGIYCYDFKGDVIWSRDLGRITSRLGWGEAVTPALHGDSLVLNWDQEANSKLICLNTKDGKTRWDIPREEKTSWNTPLIVERKGTTQVILNATNRIRSYDLKDGSPLWSCAGMTVNAIPSPVSDGENVYVVSGYRGSAGVGISLDSRGEVTPENGLLWQIKEGTPYVPSPLLVNGHLYFTQANQALLTIIEAKTGKILVNRERLPGVTSFYGSPVAAAGKVYLTARNGTTLVLEEGETLDVVATNKLDDPIDASPVPVGNQLFLRGEKFLYCIQP